jgi:hypothetical protein
VGTGDRNVSVGDPSASTHVRFGEIDTVTATIRNGGDVIIREVAYRIVGNVLAAEFASVPRTSRLDYGDKRSSISRSS